MLSPEVVKALIIALGVLSGSVFSLSIWAIWDAWVDLKVVRRSRPELTSLASLRLVRSGAWLLSSAMLLFIASTFLLETLRVWRLWVTVATFFDFPIMATLVLVYDRIVNRTIRRRLRG